jgi:hypothetical protein
MRDGLNFLFLNLGHFFDHFFILIIATVVLALGYIGICAIFRSSWRCCTNRAAGEVVP